jgi:hypothetical protein
MLRRYLHGFAYLLLLVMPLQSIAAANMLVCNSLMQSNHKLSIQTGLNADTEAGADSMPCHSAEADVADHQQSTPIAGKGHCGALCNTLCTVATLPHILNLGLIVSASNRVITIDQTYVSITLPAFQRPPIFLS